MVGASAPYLKKYLTNIITHDIIGESSGKVHFIGSC